MAKSCQGELPLRDRFARSSVSSPIQPFPLQTGLHERTSSFSAIGSSPPTESGEQTLTTSWTLEASTFASQHAFGVLGKSSVGARSRSPPQSQVAASREAHMDAQLRRKGLKRKDTSIIIHFVSVFLLRSWGLDVNLQHPGSHVTKRMRLKTINVSINAALANLSITEPQVSQICTNIAIRITYVMAEVHTRSVSTRLAWYMVQTSRGCDYSDSCVCSAYCRIASTPRSLRLRTLR